MKDELQNPEVLTSLEQGLITIAKISGALPGEVGDDVEPIDVMQALSTITPVAETVFGTGNVAFTDDITGTEVSTNEHWVPTINGEEIKNIENLRKYIFMLGLKCIQTLYGVAEEASEQQNLDIQTSLNLLLLTAATNLNPNLRFVTKDYLSGIANAKEPRSYSTIFPHSMVNKKNLEGVVKLIKRGDWNTGFIATITLGDDTLYTFKKEGIATEIKGGDGLEIQEYYEITWLLKDKTALFSRYTELFPGIFAAISNKLKLVLNLVRGNTNHRISLARQLLELTGSRESQNNFVAKLAMPSVGHPNTLHIEISLDHLGAIYKAIIPTRLGPLEQNPEQIQKILESHL